LAKGGLGGVVTPYKSPQIHLFQRGALKTVCRHKAFQDEH
jgi:hypothetical protein